MLGRKDAALLGVESEVDSLNHKLKILSKDLADRKALEGTGGDNFSGIKELADEKNKYKNELVQAHRNQETLNEKVHQLQSSLNSLQAEMSASKENLAIAKALLKKEGGNDDALDTISRLQKMWEELGADDSLREEAQRRIEFCLEDTCANLLENATTMKSSAEKEISSLFRRLRMMKRALGLSNQGNEKDPSKTLTKTLTHLKEELSKLEMPYRFAAARRSKIVEGATSLSATLGLTTSQLHDDLKVLLQHRTSEGRTVSEEDTKMDADDSLPAKCLETEFLTRCEGHVSELRVAKSEMLLKSREHQQKIAVFMTKMHLNTNQSLSLIADWIKRNEAKSSKWWDSKLAEEIISDLSQGKYLPLSSAKHSEHLELMNRAMSTSADSRQSISETLKSVIEHAQKILLSIVGREIDASEAYAGFHNALIRMPPLSKDLIQACISELESLIDGIEAMAQTETEALTVVWEALKVSQTERRDFWSMLEKSKSIAGLDNENPFSDKSIGAISSHEGWMVNAVKSATNLNRTLKRRLRKLEGINNEVERLRSKQDTKSKILSLDSEIRIMNAKLLDFEELKCNKERLLTKKTGGTTLLKEERFRKQMQTKFLAKLKQLVSLLQSWESKEKSRFDDSLLSDDVRELLKEDTDQMESWVDMRTKLMRLRTVKAPVLRNRTNELPSLRSQQMEKHNSRHATGLTPPKKRRAPPIPRSKPSSRVTTKPSNDKPDNELKNSKVRIRSAVDIGEQSPKRRKRSPAAMPFGSILADSPQRR